MIETINNLIKELKENNLLSPKNIADSNYTIRELYEHRLLLFKVICHMYPNLSWKTKIHADGTMYNDSFLAGITTPLGEATYHFKTDYYHLFNVKEIPLGPVYDGYKPGDVLIRIESLNQIKPKDLFIDETFNDYVESKITDDEYSESLNQIIKELKEYNIIKTTDISDGNHTIKELYKQKRDLFKFICHSYPNLAYKYNNQNDTFIAGINIDNQDINYIFNKEYYDEFKIKDVEELNGNNNDTIKKLYKIKAW